MLNNLEYDSSNVFSYVYAYDYNHDHYDYYDYYDYNKAYNKVYQAIAELKNSDFQLLNEILRSQKLLETERNLSNISNINTPDNSELFTILTAIEPSQHLYQYGQYNNTAYPLHIAAALGDIATLKNLLKLGHSIEQRDDLNLTPLQVAAVSGHPETVSFLLSKGANAFASNAYKFNLNALDLAIMNRQAAVVQVLIEEGHVLDKANVNEMAYLYNLSFGMVWALAPYCEGGKAASYFNEALSTFITLVNTLELALLEFPVTEGKNIEEITGIPATILLAVVASQVTNTDQYNHILNEISKINATDSCYQTYLDAKAIFHVLPVHGNYNLIYHKPDNKPYLSKITAEGHWGSFTTPLALKMIDSYIEDKLFIYNQYNQYNQKSVYTAFESIREIYNYAELYSKESGIFAHSQEAYERYQNGNMVLLPSGWNGHFVNVILDPTHDYFIVANCGMRYQGLASGANIYQMYNPDYVSPNLIYSILNNREQMDLELVYKYQLALDRVEGLWQPDQVYGNCAWQSHEPAMEALLYLDFLNQGYSKSDAKTMAHTQYVNWDAYQTLTQLKQYFDNNPNLGIQALKDILVENHPSLFLSKNKGTDTGINAAEYAQAKYIVSVLTQDLYKKEVASVFFESLKKAKPELLSLFKSAGFSFKNIDKLDVSDVFSDESDIFEAGILNSEPIFDVNSELIGIDSLFKHDFAPIFPGLEFILDTRSDWI